MRIVAADIPGVFDLLPEPKGDARGYLAKTFEAPVYAAAGLATRFEEELHTSSRRGVLRGMHFQTPPAVQAKVVFCEHGSVFDAVVDLRRGSPAFGRAVTRELTAESANGLYVPVGCAHGFVALSDEAVVSYRLTASFSPEDDAGILWSSVGIAWPVERPIVSERDASLPGLRDFTTPFVLEA